MDGVAPMMADTMAETHFSHHPPTMPPAQKRQFFDYFLAVFLYIWPLAGPNIAEKGWPLLGKALGRVRDGFGRVPDGFGKPLILEMQVFGA